MNSNIYQLSESDLSRLLTLSQEEGYELIGPKVEDEAIHYREISGIADLPQGITDQQAPGRYRLQSTDSTRRFHFNLGADSLKEYIHPKSQRLFAIECRTCNVTMDHPETPKLALLGVRACELEGAKKLLNVHNHENHHNASTQSRRDHLLIIAVDCSKACSTCFCLSVGGSPEVTEGADLALSELEGGYLARAISEKGKVLLDRLNLTTAEAEQIEEAKQQIEQVKEEINPKLKTLNLKENLQANAKEEVWQDVASRCLGCGSCTMVCPSCFCVNYEDQTSVDGKQSERHQVWDSCFSLDYSYMHGGYARKETSHRYRQWITHKLAGWVDQFEEIGCSGCGRCITWCPVGIDITEEALKASSFPTPK